ncbi:MAG: N-acetylmuramoyl-L-alanine amidase [Rhizobiaceae bacterium]
MKVCVDPGHGMSNRSSGVFDPGAVHNENGTLFREADIALRYGLTLKDVLRARGVEVFMTRDDNDDVAPVGERANAARNANCSFFVSFHMNSVEDDDANGTETLFRDEADRAFAQRIQNHLIGVLGLRDRGLKQRNDLAVLRFQGTAVLIELGFIGNDRDRDRILQPQVRSAVCEAVADVIGN